MNEGSVSDHELEALYDAVDSSGDGTVSPTELSVFIFTGVHTRQDKGGGGGDGGAGVGTLTNGGRGHVQNMVVNNAPLGGGMPARNAHRGADKVASQHHAHNADSHDVHASSGYLNANTVAHLAVGPGTHPTPPSHTPQDCKSLRPPTGFLTDCLRRACLATTNRDCARPARSRDRWYERSNQRGQGRRRTYHRTEPSRDALDERNAAAIK